MKRFLSAFILAFVLPSPFVHAQINSPSYTDTNKVIALDTDDAQQAKNLFAAMADLQLKITKFNTFVTTKYTAKAPCVPTEASFCVYGTYNFSTSENGKTTTFEYLPGWAGGFVFSDDYKYITPKYRSTCGDNGVLVGQKCYYELHSDWIGSAYYTGNGLTLTANPAPVAAVSSPAYQSGTGVSPTPTLKKRKP